MRFTPIRTNKAQQLSDDGIEDDFVPQSKVEHRKNLRAGHSDEDDFVIQSKVEHRKNLRAEHHIKGNRVAAAFDLSKDQE